MDETIQVPKSETILDQSPPEVQAYFETARLRRRALAQVGRLKAKRKTLKTGLKKKRKTLREKQNALVKTMWDERHTPSSEEVEAYADRHVDILVINKKVSKAEKSAGCSGEHISEPKDAAEIYDGDLKSMETVIDGLPDPDDDPMTKIPAEMLARIEVFREKKKDKAKA